MLIEQGREGCEVGTVGRMPDAQHLGPVCLQGRPEVEVARVIHQNRIAGTEQQPADQIQGMRGRTSQKQVFPCGFDAVTGQPDLQQSTQGLRAAGSAVVDQGCRVLAAGERTAGATQRIQRHPVRRKPATARFEGRRCRIQCLP